MKTILLLIGIATNLLCGCSVNIMVPREKPQSPIIPAVEMRKVSSTRTVMHSELEEPIPVPALFESSAVVAPGPIFRRLMASPDLSRPLSQWVQVNQPDGSFGTAVNTNGEIEYIFPGIIPGTPQQFYTAIP